MKQCARSAGRRWLGLLAVLLALAGCSADSTAGPQVDVDAESLEIDLAQARVAWRDGDRSDYSYLYFRTCKCEEPEPQGPNRVFVRDGAVTTVKHFGTREALDGFTAEDLFQQIDEAIEDGKRVSASFHPDTGLPASLNLDLDGTPDADPLILSIESFISYADLRAELNSAKQRWATVGPDDYELSYRTDDETEGADSSDLSVSDMFDLVAAAIDSLPDSISVRYEPELGHPVDIDFDPDVRQSGTIRINDVSITASGPEE